MFTRVRYKKIYIEVSRQGARMAVGTGKVADDRPWLDLELVLRSALRQSFHDGVVEGQKQMMKSAAKVFGKPF